MDTEWRQVVRDLRRRSAPGDERQRAADWITQQHTTLSRPGSDASAPPVGPDRSQFNGLVGMQESQVRARQYVERNEPTATTDDHTVRDMLTKETLAVLRQEREHTLASKELGRDHDYIAYISEICGGQYRHIGTLIALVARFAGEVPHELIHPSTYKLLQARLDRENYASQAAAARDLTAFVTQQLPGHTWETFVDPGLAGNCRIACHEISTMLPTLHGLNMQHVTGYAALHTEESRRFYDFFCSVVASVWRLNSVMAAQPYKTKYEHEAVRQALQFTCRRLIDYTLHNGAIRHSTRAPPTSLAQLRNTESSVFY